jgi:hypothetical protein
VSFLICCYIFDLADVTQYIDLGYGYVWMIESRSLPSDLDTGIIETNLDAQYGGSTETWANALATRIQVIIEYT